SEDVANAVREKQATDIAETARLIAKGTPVARINTGIDGGMHKVFAARVPEGNTGLSEGGDAASLSTFSLARAPGTIPSHVNPPKSSVDSKTSPSENLLMGAPDQPKLVAAPAQAPAPAPTRVANAAPAGQEEGGWFSNIARKVGFGGNSDATASTAPAKPKATETKPAEAKQPARPEAAAPKPTAPKVEAKQHTAVSRPPLKPSASDASATAAPAAKDNQVAGSAPIVSSHSFDSRFQAVK
ncbi:MAG: hypothetical protein ABW175_18520, partial [Bradyrhizobium sp.]